MDSEVLIRVPAEDAADFRLLWSQLRMAEGLPPALDLHGGERLERFDAAALVEWVVTLAPVATPIVTAVLGYLVARRGEIEVRAGSNVLKFKNMTPRQIEDAMASIRKSLER